MPTVKEKSGYTALNKKGDLRVIWGQIAISATIRVSGRWYKEKPPPDGPWRDFYGEQV